jgi:hypothetical protein
MDSVYTLVEELFYLSNITRKYISGYNSAKQLEEPNPFREKRLYISNTISVFQNNPETNIQSFQWKISEPTRKKYCEFRNKN